MQGTRSLGGDLTPVNDNINHIRRLRKHLRRLVEEHNIVPIEVEEVFLNTLKTSDKTRATICPNYISSKAILFMKCEMA